MKKKVVNFYEDKGLRIVDIIELGKQRRGLHPLQIETALEIVYKEVMDELANNQDVNYSGLARRVWETARQVRSKHYIVGRGVIEDQRKQIKAMRQERIYIGILVIVWFVWGLLK